MSPNSLESRFARLEQRVQDHDIDIRQYAPLVAEFSRLEERIDHIRADLDWLRKEITSGNREESNNRFSRRQLVWTAVFGTLGTLIALGALIVSVLSLAHG